MDSWTTTSPDGRNAMTVRFDDEGRLRFDVVRDGELVVGDGTLGIVLRDVDLGSGLVVESIGEPIEFERPYSLVHGKRRIGNLQAVRRVLPFRGESGGRLDIVVCAARDGVGFRYVLPGTGEEEHEIVEEMTTFSFVGEGMAWLQPAQEPGFAQPAYEELYFNGVPLHQQTSAPAYNMPALFHVGDTWALLAEADLDDGYVGVRLDNTGRGAEFRASFPHEGEGGGYGAVEPKSRLPWTLPWRVVILGDTPAAVATSDLVNALARPRTDDYRWVRPGRVSWSWWSEHASPRDAERLRDYVDLAAEMGWEYTLIDANWDELSDETIRDLIDYAAERNVGVFLWYNSGGPNNEVPEQPRDRMFDADVRRKEMDRILNLGVAGMKIDFFHSDKQAGIRLYLDIIRDAALRRLMVNFHGSTVPRGWSRTWPHVMTMEGVAGAEQYSFRPDYPAAAPWHNTVLAFTRNVVGPMDYTPVTFSDQLYPHVTTNAHELALAVVFESGLLHLADSSASYRSVPDAVRRMLEAVPVAWDDTIVLDGSPGEFVVVARRKGDEWYVAAINGVGESRSVDIVLDMVSEPVVADIVLDGATPRTFAWTRAEAAPGDHHTLPLAPYGGFLVRMRPAAG